LAQRIAAARSLIKNDAPAEISAGAFLYDLRGRRFSKAFHCIGVYANCRWLDRLDFMMSLPNRLSVLISIMYCLVTPLEHFDKRSIIVLFDRISVCAKTYQRLFYFAEISITSKG